MKYISTRDKKNVTDAASAIINGISKEGGLFIPEEFPKLGDIDNLMNL
ncbi:MAG: threonine synthase, partial [Tissierellia bacterium]|nr:threonine synthase [Tissierellia bacterium]